MAEKYTVKEYIEFIEQGRFDKISPTALKMLAEYISILKSHIEYLSSYNETLEQNQKTD